MSYPYQKAFRLADIYRSYWQEYIGSPSRNLKLEPHHFKAVNYSMACRTSKMGYHHFKCQDCGEHHYLYHSCKHRFCGSCGSAETHRWVENQLANLLEMKHHHVVFTLPVSLRGLCKRNGKVMYNLLFRSSQLALSEWFADRHQLKCGIVSVLHTAGSDLKYHPHVHLIVSGGGLNTTTGEWKELQGDYLANHKHLRKRFRHHFLAGLRKLNENKTLQLTTRASYDFGGLTSALSEQDWIISIQPPLHDRTQIMGYVGRYTKRSCLSEYRIRQVANGMVSFTYKDYRNSPRNGPIREATKQMGAVSFLDRLLRHVPEKGFRMVRYYGLYSNRYRHLRGNTAKVKQDIEDKSAFEQHKDYWQEVYQEEALCCKSCQRPLSYLGQHFPNKNKRKIVDSPQEFEDSS